MVTVDSDSQVSFSTLSVAPRMNLHSVIILNKDTVPGSGK